MRHLCFVLIVAVGHYLFSWGAMVFFTMACFGSSELCNANPARFILRIPEFIMFFPRVLFNPTEGGEITARVLFSTFLNSLVWGVSIRIWTLLWKGDRAGVKIMIPALGVSLVFLAGSVIIGRPPTLEARNIAAAAEAERGREGYIKKSVGQVIHIEPSCREKYRQSRMISQVSKSSCDQSREDCGTGCSPRMAEMWSSEDCSTAEKVEFCYPENSPLPTSIRGGY